MSLGFNGCTWSQVGELEAAIFSTLLNDDIVDSDILFVVADPSSPLFPLVCFICPSFLRVLFSRGGELHLSSDPNLVFRSKVSVAMACEDSVCLSYGLDLWFRAWSSVVLCCLVCARVSSGAVALVGSSAVVL
ncbi:hypothetical protein Bca52824_049209 [Brassica carinata]|uniref:Uncharacterized protein n=1 Tax=Brassica carinata TaxID=52824 RepID=A0A8X7URK2_BRACI|nr:hypothetical protein Bca52824_049209 [Brassica carinata]